MPAATQGLADNAKKVSIEVLEGVLADGIDLYNMTRHAHWNVKGPQFASLHQLFEEFYTQLATDIDDVAERLVTLGATAVGVSQHIPGRTRLAPYPVELRQGEGHLKELIGRYGQVAKALREGIEQADEAGDADTADLLTGLSRRIDKALWMMEATAER